MSEREMLERAAAAAGIELEWPVMHGKRVEGLSPRRTDTWELWNPRLYSGDALELAGLLRITVCYTADETTVCAWKSGDPTGGMYEFMHPGGEADAMRLAITRAAAALAPTAQGE